MILTMVSDDIETSQPLNRTGHSEIGCGGNFQFLDEFGVHELVFVFNVEHDQPEVARGRWKSLIQNIAVFVLHTKDQIGPKQHGLIYLDARRSCSAGRTHHMLFAICKNDLCRSASTLVSTTDEKDVHVFVGKEAK